MKTQTRKFSGKVFKFGKYCKNKKEAKEEAKELRKQGALARIVPVKSFYGDYAVWYK